MGIASWTSLPGFTVLARSENSPAAAMGDPGRRFYGVQFHPEVVHTPCGRAHPRKLPVSHLPLPSHLDHEILRR